MKKGLLRTLCGLMAALMLLVCIGTPVTTEAASKLPYYIKINRQQNCVTVYALDFNGNYTKPVKAFACSVGVNNATPKGTFAIPAKYRWHALMGNVYGQYCSRITGGVLFHSVFYSSQDPSKLAYNSYNRLGQTASHGCVRLCVADAKWIYDNCPVGTKVTIYDSSNPGPLGKPTPIRIDTSSPYRGWDPTDPDPRNPWLKLNPTIKGAKDKTIERTTKKVDLKKGVTATDAQGNSLTVKVSGTVKAKTAGKYKITYTATDKRGRKTQKTITITVKDTKKPTVSLVRKSLTYNKAVSEKKLVKEVKANVKATDLGEKLSGKYIYVTNTSKVLKAMKNKKYGTYTVTVYAKDKAGNKSKTKKVTIKFVNPNPEQPTKPTEPTDPTTPTEPTEPTEPTDPATPTDPVTPTEPTDPATNPSETTDITNTTDNTDNSTTGTETNDTTGTLTN